MLNEDMVVMLGELIQTTDDRTKVFAAAAEEAAKPKLKTLFQQCAVESSTAGIELRCLVQRLGGVSNASGSLPETAVCSWTPAIGRLGDPDIAILEQLARAEFKMKAPYAKALLAGFPQTIRSVLQRQHDDIIRNHNLIIDMQGRTQHAGISEASSHSTTISAI